VFIDALRYCSAFIVSDKLGSLDPECEDPAVLQLLNIAQALTPKDLNFQ
jgi:hypothetical protein